MFGSVANEDIGEEEEFTTETEIAEMTNACKLCGDLHLFALKTDGQHCFCCENCGWTQPCSKVPNRSKNK